MEKAERMEEILALARAKASPEKRDAVERFVNEYFQQVAPEDLMERRADDLYGAALSHWNFARKREPGKPKLRVFNPTVEEHGWQSTHTVIEIVNDDMPFLVDSVTMEVNRHGLTLHLIIHPIMLARRRADGGVEEMPAAPGEGVGPESLMHVEVDRIVSPDKCAALWPIGRRCRRKSPRRSVRSRPPVPLWPPTKCSKARRFCDGSPRIISPSSTTAASNASTSRARYAASIVFSGYSLRPPTAPNRRRSRCCAERRRTSSRAPASRPAATPARRCSTSSRPTRATSCSR